MSLAEVMDRMEIQAVLAAYSEAIDTRNWNALDDVFAPGAVIDYTEMGGLRGDLETIKAYLDGAMGKGSHFASFQHMLGQSSIVVDGDRATARTACFNPMVIASSDDRAEHVYFCGLWYRDVLVRTAAGWRISDRYEQRAYKHNRPDWAPLANQ